MNKKTKTNPSTTSLSVHIGFRCPNEIFYKASTLWGKEKTKWIVAAMQEKLERANKKCP